MATIIIINGYPKSGKDEFVKILQKNNTVVNHSTVKVVKEIARWMGWNGKKTPESRRMLSDLKDLYTKYFDGPFNDAMKCINVYCSFTTIDYVVVHVREPEEIDKIYNECKNKGYDVHALFIIRDTDTVITNHADKNVENYEYDYYIENNGSLQLYEESINTFIDSIKSKEKT